MSRTLILGVVVVGGLVTLAACGKNPVSSETSDNPAIVIDKLFEHDGCTVYRFSDAGYYRYYAKCQAGDSKVSWSESAGKTTRPVEISSSLVR